MATDPSYSKDVKHFPFFIRQLYADSKLQTKQFYKYELIALAKNTNTALDVYLTYFLSPFNQNYHRVCEQNGVKRLQLVKLEHVSIFFLLFVEIYVLKCLASKNMKRTQAINALINDLFGFEPDLYTPLAFFIKQKIKHDFESKYSEIFSESATNFQFSKLWTKINEKIIEILQKFNLKVDADIEVIKQTECLATNVEDSFLKWFIKSNFRCISNIHVFGRSFKKQILSEFQETVRRKMFIKVQLLMETLTSKEKNNNLIYLPTFSTEREPILTQLYDYLRRQPPQEKESIDREKLILYQWIKQIILICLQYHQSTKSSYPNLTTDDFGMDLKAQQIVINHNALIIDAIGLRGQVKSAELRLATQPTPSANFQASHLQKQKQWCFLRKYYSPSKVSKQDPENKKNQQVQPKDEEKVLEHACCWRLMNILYQVLNLKRLTNVKYNEMTTNKPFTISQYHQIVKTLYTNLLSGDLDFDDIIPPESKYIPIEINKHIPSQFTFQIEYFAQKFNVQSKEDSLFDHFKLSNFSEYLLHRSQLIYQIIFVINYPKAFKRMPNAKKYVISFFLNIIEILHLQILMRGSSKDVGNFRDQLVTQLNRTTLFKEFVNKIETLKSIISKFNEYKLRRDGNAKYLQRSRLDEIILNIQNGMEEIDALERHETSISQNNWQDKDEERQAVANILESVTDEDDFISHDISSFKTSINNQDYQNESLLKDTSALLNNLILRKSKRLINQTQKQFVNFIDEQIKPFIDQPSKFHNEEDLTLKEPLQKEVFKYLNYKLLTLIDMYLFMNKENFRKIQMLFASSAFDILRQGRNVNEFISAREIKIHSLKALHNNIKKEMNIWRFEEDQGFIRTFPH